MADVIKDYARIFGRGFLIVSLTATNAYQVSHGKTLGAFIVGTAISLVWWSNARTSSKSELKFAGLVYGLGAGVGTAAGMTLAAAFYGGF